MADRKSYTVKAALVSIRDSEGTPHHLYAGAKIPDGMRADDLERLTADGLIGPDAPDVLPGVAPRPVPPTR